MSKRADIELMADFVDAIEKILKYTKLLTYKRFLCDQKSQDAVIRNFEIIGEATKQLSKEFTKAHPTIPWSHLARLRDRLIHHYSGVNFDILWDIIENDLLPLKNKLKKIAKQQ